MVGEEEKRDTSGNTLVGGRSLLCEQENRAAGGEIWEKIRNKIQHLAWVRPPATYYKDSNRVSDNESILVMVQIVIYSNI